MADVSLKLHAKLNDHFSLKKNMHHARCVFLKMRSLAGETTSVYIETA